MTDLLDGARGLGLELDDSQCAKLLAHLDLLDDWNTRMNLTAIRERPSQITKHVLDSLTLATWLRGKRVERECHERGEPVCVHARHYATV